MLDKIMGGKDNQAIVLAMATAIGATGVFPKAPAKLIEILDNDFMKWFCFFALLWQGGCEQDTEFALKMTVLCFVIYLVFDNME